jgi:hypothetical protein
MGQVSRSAGTVEPVQVRLEGQLGEVRLYRSTCTGQPDRAAQLVSLDRKAWLVSLHRAACMRDCRKSQPEQISLTGQLGQFNLDRLDGTGQPGEVSSDKSTGRSAWTGQHEQGSLDGADCAITRDRSA